MKLTLKAVTFTHVALGEPLVFVKKECNTYRTGIWSMIPDISRVGVPQETAFQSAIDPTLAGFRIQCHLGQFEPGIESDFREPTSDV